METGKAGRRVARFILLLLTAKHAAGLLGAKIPDLHKLQHPYLVSVHRQGDDRLLCSGALVSEKVVLTASSCLDKSSSVRIRTLEGQWVSSETWDLADLSPEQQIKLAAVTLQERVPGPHLEVGSASCWEEDPDMPQEHLTFVSFGGGDRGSVLTAKASVGSYPCGGTGALLPGALKEERSPCVTLDAPHACSGGLGGLIVSSSGGTQVAVGVATSVTCSSVSSEDPSAQWFSSAVFALVQPELQGINMALIRSWGGTPELLPSVVETMQEGEAAFRNPQGAAMALGRLIVADTGNDALRSVNPDTGDIETLLKFSGFRPRGVAAVDNSIYVTGNHLVVMVDASTKQPYLVAGSSGSPMGTIDGPLPSARFSYPRGIAVMESGVIFVADTGSGNIRIINPKDYPMMGQRPKTVGTVRGTGQQLQRPYGLLPFQGDKLLVSDKHRISVLSPDGSGGYSSTVLAGSTSPGSSDHWDGQRALFSSPSSMVLNGTELLVSDRDNSAVRSIDTATGRVRTVYDGKGASGAPLKQPEGLVLGADGSALYAVSSGTKRLIKLPAELLRRSAVCRKKKLAAHTGGGTSSIRSGYWLG